MPRRVPSADGHGFAERDADILDRVVLIDIEIAAHLQAEVERAVARHQLEHMVEETNAGRDVVTAAPLDPELQSNRRFARVARDHRPSHSTSVSASIARLVSSTTPAVTRMQPSQPGSFDRSRTLTPRAASARDDVCRAIADPHQREVCRARPGVETQAGAGAGDQRA